jgi:hypothetical protein
MKKYHVRAVRPHRAIAIVAKMEPEVDATCLMLVLCLLLCLLLRCLRALKARGGCYTRRSAGRTIHDLGNDELVHVFGHLDQAQILQARLAMRAFRAAGAAAITTLYAHNGLLPSKAWLVFINASYVVSAGGHKGLAGRLARLLLQLPPRAGVVKAYSSTLLRPPFGTCLVARDAPELPPLSAAAGSPSPGQATAPRGGRRRAAGGPSRRLHSGPGLQYLDCSLPLTALQADALLAAAGQGLASARIRVYKGGGARGWRPRLPQQLCALDVRRVPPPGGCLLEEELHPMQLDLRGVSSASHLQHLRVHNVPCRWGDDEPGGAAAQQRRQQDRGGQRRRRRRQQQQPEGAPLRTLHLLARCVREDQMEATFERLLSDPASLASLHVPEVCVASPEGWRALLLLEGLQDLRLAGLAAGAAARLPQAQPTGEAALLAAGLPQLRRLHLGSSAGLRELLGALRGHEALESLQVDACADGSPAPAWWQQGGRLLGPLPALRVVSVKRLRTRTADWLLQGLAACRSLQQLCISIDGPPVEATPSEAEGQLPEAGELQQVLGDVFKFSAQPLQPCAGSIGLSSAGLSALTAGCCSTSLASLSLVMPELYRPSQSDAAALLGSGLAQRLRGSGGPGKLRLLVKQPPVRKRRGDVKKACAGPEEEPGD